MSKTEPSVTINPQLSATYTELLKLLPLTVRDGNSIVIYNLPASLSYKALGDSPILNIYHQMKHLYSNGDRVGYKGIAKKLAENEHLENNTIRMCISYTCSLRKEHNGTKTLTIGFLPSFAKHHLPRFIQQFNKSDLTSKELEEIKTNGQITSNTHQSVTVEHEMNEKEIAEQMDVFISTCREEISNYLFNKMESAIETATTNIISNSECVAAFA